VSPAAGDDGAEPTAAALIAEGRRLLQTGRILQAEEMMARAVALDEENGAAWNLLGHIRYAAKHWPEAIAAFERARALRPEEPRLLTSIGICRFEMRQYDEARVALRAALALDADLARPYLFLGRISRTLGEAEAAERELRRAVDLAPEDPLHHYYLGLLLFKEGRYEEAAGNFRRCLELSPDFPSAHLNLGLVLTRLGRREEGRRHLERFEALTEVATKDQQKSLRVASHLNAAREDLEAGRTDSALALALEALEIAPEVPIVHLHLALIYSRMGRADESRQARAEAERLQRTGTP